MMQKRGIGLLNIWKDNIYSKQTKNMVCLRKYAVSLIFFMVLSLNQNLHSQGTVDVVAIPSEVNTTIGETFTVDIMLMPDDADFTAAQIAMNFNPDLISVTSLSISSESLLDTEFPGLTIDNTTGYFY